MEENRWIDLALSLGFSTAVPLDVRTLSPRADIRAMCAADKCRAYGKNWTCPPHCGDLEDCSRKIGQYSSGILLQTVGKLSKIIDTRMMRRTEEEHLARFSEFCASIRREFPDALCLGTGGCRICGSCAWPEPCRFPAQACPSMEGYGLFVTQVCRSNGLAYHHGEKTVTYTACVLFSSKDADGNLT